MAAVEHRWEWTLPDGVRIAATLDPSERVESVFVGDRLVSEAPRGSKPDGHVLEKPAGVVVKFQRGALICILRVDGEEVSPNVWPVRKRADRPKPNLVAVPFKAIGIAAIACLAIGGAYWAWTSRAPASDAPGSSLESAVRAENGKFVAHHPKRFVRKRAQLPANASGVVLVDEERSESIVIIALAGEDAPREAWLVQKTLHGEALANIPRDGKLYEETARGDESCMGKPSAVVRGKARTAKGDPANLWSCAFAHDGTAYLAMYSVRADAPSEDGRRLRDIVDATEITQLAPLPTQ